MFLALFAQLALTDSGWLGGVPTVVNCDPRAQLYLPALDLIPARHGMVVHEVVIWDRPGAWACGASDPKPPALRLDRLGAILLPGDRCASEHIRHEVGHLVGDQDDGRLIRAWRAAIWTNSLLEGDSTSGLVERMWSGRKGSPVGVDETAWQSDSGDIVREDFAESYSRPLINVPAHPLDEQRLSFMRDQAIGAGCSSHSRPAEPRG